MKKVVSYHTLTNTEKNKRIVLISDIHFYRDTKLNLLQTLVLDINRLKPNYICIAGDLIDNVSALKYKNSKLFYSLIEELGTISPVIIVLGNHDVYKLNKNHKREYAKDEKMIQTIKSFKNVYLLENESIILDGIQFTGYELPFEYYLRRQKKETLVKDAKEKIAPAKGFSILLFHNPIRLFPIYYDVIKDYRLVLCGHTHNGMVPSFIQKGHWGIISPGKKLFPQKIRGKIVHGNTTAIISGGVTKLSYSSGKFHQFNHWYPLELTVVDLQ